MGSAWPPRSTKRRSPLSPSGTGGSYLAADDAAGLAEIHRSIDLKFEREAEPTEVTGLVAAVAVLLLGAGGALSLVWFGRVV